MKKILGLGLFLTLFIPSVSFASTLNRDQVNAIIGLLEAFGVNAQTVALVRSDIEPVATSTQATSTPATTFTPIVATTTQFGSVSVQQTQPAPVVPVFAAAPQVASCDDTPQFNIVAYTQNDDNSTTSLDMPPTVASSTTYRNGYPSIGWPNIFFKTTVTSGCNSHWVVDTEWSNASGYKSRFSNPSPAAAEVSPSEVGIIPVLFQAHDGTTSATTTVYVHAN